MLRAVVEPTANGEAAGGTLASENGIGAPGGGPDTESTGIAGTGDGYAAGALLEPGSGERSCATAADPVPKSAVDAAAPPGKSDDDARELGGTEENADGGGGRRLCGPPFSLGASGDKNGFGLGISQLSSTADDDSRRTMVRSSSSSSGQAVGTLGAATIIAGGSNSSTVTPSSRAGVISCSIGSKRAGVPAVNVRGTGGGGADSAGAANDTGDSGAPLGMELGVGAGGEGGVVGNVAVLERAKRPVGTFVGAEGWDGVGLPQPPRGAGAPLVRAMSAPEGSVRAVPDTGEGGEAAASDERLFSRSSNT